MARIAWLIVTLAVIVGCERKPAPAPPPVVPKREIVYLDGLPDCYVLDEADVRQLDAGVSVYRFSDHGVFRGTLRNDLADYTVHQIVVRIKAVGWQAPFDFTVRLTINPMSTAKFAINGGQSGLQLDGPVHVISALASQGGEPTPCRTIAKCPDEGKFHVCPPPKKPVCTPQASVQPYGPDYVPSQIDSPVFGRPGVGTRGIR